MTPSCFYHYGLICYWVVSCSGGQP